MRGVRPFVAGFFLVLVWAGCDVVEPVDDSILVVEGFLTTGAPLPQVRVQRTLLPGASFSPKDAAIVDAKIELEVAGNKVDYHAEKDRPGIYAPDPSDVEPRAGADYLFRARWHDEAIETRGILPEEIGIAGVDVSIPDEPVAAVFLDSLSLGDSLATGAYTGFIYPVEVEVRWSASEVDDSWLRLQLKPYAAVSSSVIDLFLKSDAIVREADQEAGKAGERLWRGVYAVGVPDADAPMPDHQLRVSIVRSGEDYARFAASRDAPDRREPISNLDGAVGIFTAIAVDSLHVRVVQDVR